MRRPGRETLLAVAVMVLLIVLTIAAAIYKGQEEQVPALSSKSSAPDGARALWLWLETLGHSVDNQVSERFEIPPETDVVMILEPSGFDRVTSEDWKELERWVAEGGFLFLASYDGRFVSESSPLKITLNSLLEEEYLASAPVPVFRAPPLAEPVRLDVRWWLKTEREDAIPLLAVKEGPLALEFIQGKGRILVIASSSFLSNAGLKEPGHARLALNLLAALPKGSRVWMDEWHHGERLNKTATGPEAWLLNTPAGLSVLFCAVVIFIGLALSGRSFGRPVPLPSSQIRRTPLEYVAALANMSRRAGHRRALMQQYRVNLKRAFGRRYRLDTGLPDKDFVALLGRYNLTLDTQALLDLLIRLNRSHFSEAQIVHLAREAADWMRDLEKI